MPVALFPVHLLSDTYTEIIMADLEANDWMFWIVLLIDVVMLVMRDADLYTDISKWVQSSDNCISRLFFRALQLSQMLTRGDDVGIDLWHAMAGDARDKHKRAEKSGEVAISATMRMYVNRQTVASCAFSEILSSAILLSLALG